MFQWVFSNFSTPPEVEHVKFEHPARSLSTTHHWKLSLNVDRHLRHRGTLDRWHDILNCEGDVMSHVAHVLAQTCDETVVSMFT